MEVGLGGGVGEAVVLAEAVAVLLAPQLVGEDGLDLALELVRGRQFRRTGARGGPALGTGGTHLRPKDEPARSRPTSRKLFGRSDALMRIKGSVSIP